MGGDYRKVRPDSGRVPPKSQLIITISAKLQMLNRGDPEPSDGELCQMLRNLAHVIHPRGFILEWVGPGGVKEGTIYEFQRLRQEERAAKRQTVKRKKAELERAEQGSLW